MTGLLVPLLLLGICALAVYVLTLPFRAARRGSPPQPQTPEGAPGETAARMTDAVPAALLDEKDRVFQALADLRFDFEAGKISAEDFAEEDGRLRTRAARILAELDAAGSPEAPPSSGPPHDRSPRAPDRGSP